jgi:4-hydroxybenzoate polyprenyltransferase
MADASLAGPFRPSVLLVLGRVSNLPTVWTNVLAAAALSGADPFTRDLPIVLVAMTLFYCGGMYLNDAFDRDIDALERPQRPIPSGRISVSTVLVIGFALLGSGIALLAFSGPAAFGAGVALAAAILLYDAFHKGNPLAPVVMGLCRALVYIGTAAALGALNGLVLIGAAAVFAHVVGLTYAAKQESLDRIGSLWPLAILAVPLVLSVGGLVSHWAVWLAWLALAACDLIAVRMLRARRPGAVPAAVGGLIAAISFVDALAIAPHAPALAVVCALGYGLTRLLHRVVPGT